MPLGSGPMNIRTTFTRGNGNSEAIRNIIMNNEEIRKKYMDKEEPEKPHETNNTFVKSNEKLVLNKPNYMFINSKQDQTYEDKKRAYNTAIYDLDTKYGHR